MTAPLDPADAGAPVFRCLSLAACLLAVLACLAGTARAGEGRLLKGAKAFKAAGRGVFVFLDADGPVDSYKWFSMDGPPRVVVDLPGSWRSDAPNRLETALDGLGAVRTGLHPGKLRIVLDVGEGVFADPEFEPQERGLRIFLPFSAPPAVIAPQPSPGKPAPLPEPRGGKAPAPEAEPAPSKERSGMDSAEPASVAEATRRRGESAPEAGKGGEAPGRCGVLDADLQGSYSGGCRGGLAHGSGEAKGLDSYQGQFRDGAKQGHGVYEWANGLRYEGEFSDDQRHGRGMLLFRGRPIYKGEFKAGLADGAGTFLFPDGGRYEGEFSKGLRHGYGIYLYPDGAIYEGAWFEDKRHGHGVYKWREGDTLNRYVGSFKDNLRHGHGRVLAKDASTGMVHVERNGRWKDDAFAGASAPRKSNDLGYALDSP